MYGVYSDSDRMRDNATIRSLEERWLDPDDRDEVDDEIFDDFYDEDEEEEEEEEEEDED